MVLTDILNIVGAVGTVGMGLMGLLFPHTAARIVGLRPVSGAGRSEFRATFGGLWIALGLVPLISGAPLAYLMLGLGWAFTAIGRVISIVLDRAGDRQNWVAVLVEAGFAGLVLAGVPIALLVDATG